VSKTIDHSRTTGITAEPAPRRELTNYVTTELKRGGRGVAVSARDVIDDV